MPASGNPVARLGREFWGRPLSSAILYLAIVAIWACVLVPRWLHRSHETPSEQELAPEHEGTADHAEADDPEDLVTADEPGADAPEFATLREQVVEVTTYVEWETPARPTAPARPAEATAPARSSQEQRPERTGQARLGRPAARRTHVLRARRRMLTILVTLAVAVAAATLVGLIRWWAVLPPAGLLGLYLLLLRETARSDAENDRRRAEAQARAALAARERARQAREALAQPTAEIIDISALATRDRDQPYDQYADAEVRAVGD